MPETCEVCHSSQCAARPGLACELTVCAFAEKDDDARMILKKICGECRVKDRDGLQALLRDLAPSGARRQFYALNLVAHSSPQDHELELGAWTISAAKGQIENISAFGAASLDHIKALGIRSIRLLGCDTLCGPGGYAAIQELQRVIDPAPFPQRIQVLGSTKRLNENDFSPEGVLFDTLRDHLRPSIAGKCASGSPLVPLGVPIRFTADLTAPAIYLSPAAGSPRTRRVLLEAKRVKELHALIDRDDVRSSPGLLTRPLISMFVPVRTWAMFGPRFHRLDVLFSYELLRFYPRCFPRGLVCPIPEDKRTPFIDLVNGLSPLP